MKSYKTMKKEKTLKHDSYSVNKNLRPAKAVILAGGAGTRLYPITKILPKPLLPVNKKPILNYLVDLFHSYRIKEIAVLVNKDFKENFEWWKKKYYFKSKIQIFEEEKPLGTFGGLYLLKKWVSGRPFFLSNGDELKKINLFKMESFHQKLQTLATIALVKVPNPQDYGVVVCKEGLVREFLEKPKDPPTSYISSGLYLLSPEIFNYHSGPKFSMIEKNIFPKLAKENKLSGFKFHGQWMDCGTWERYEKAIKNWK
jgi:NDP-sugar pyrophosphorylase family protein